MSACSQFLVIVALDMPFISIIVFEILLLATAIFHHSNLRLLASFKRGLSYIIETPEIQRVHLHDQRQDTDASYTTVLSL